MGHDFNLSTEAKENFMTRFDPRVKLVVTMVGLGAVLMTSRFYLPLAILALLVVFFVITRVTAPLLAVRLGFPALVALFIFISQVVLYGKTVFYSVNLGFLTVPLYQEGLLHGALLASRVVAGVALLLFLSLTTTMGQIIIALSWARVPEPLIEIMTVAYRYLDVFREEITRVRKAQKMRLGYTGWRNGLKAASSLGGIILLRAFDKSERLYRSMQGRGYTGSMAVTADREVLTPVNPASMAMGVTLSLLMVVLAV